MVIRAYRSVKPVNRSVFFVLTRPVSSQASLIVSGMDRAVRLYMSKHMIEGKGGYYD